MTITKGKNGQIDEKNKQIEQNSNDEVSLMKENFMQEVKEMLQSQELLLSELEKIQQELADNKAKHEGQIEELETLIKKSKISEQEMRSEIEKRDQYLQKMESETLKIQEYLKKQKQIKQANKQTKQTKS